MDQDLASIRVEYGADGFSAADAGVDPMACFAAWLAAARSGDAVAECNAMSLATTTASGAPSCRMVLLKDVEPSRAAFTWYTNLASRKSLELDASPRGALCWWWPGTPGRQVRAVGVVEHVSRAESAAYFNQRPEAARIGAIASRQSRAVVSRAALEARAAQVAGPALELPDTWGGLRLVADELEFWQGRNGRLHDRIAFLRLNDDGTPAFTDGIVAVAGYDALRTAGVETVDAHGTRWLRTRLEP